MRVGAGRVAVGVGVGATGVAVDVKVGVGSTTSTWPLEQLSTGIAVPPGVLAPGSEQTMGNG
ncbi:MAG: hypothetical protein ACHQ4J_16800 [Candidatus Binatia bacterium]